MSSKPMLHRPPPLVYPAGAGAVFAPGPPAGTDPFMYQVNDPHPRCLEPLFELSVQSQGWTGSVGNSWPQFLWLMHVALYIPAAAFVWCP